MADSVAIVTSKQNLRGVLETQRVAQTLHRVSTKWLSADQLRTQAMLAVARNPKLLQCTQASFLEAMVRAAELGLRFAGAGGEAYLIPYKTTATLIVGYRGLCALARRTGKVTRIEARVVHERDHFKVSYGSGQQLLHQPHLGEDRGQIICAYALAELRNGSIQLEVMAKDEIDLIRKRSRAGQDGPWVTDYEQMARKTVLRRLCKYLPFPTHYEDALVTEDRKHVTATEVPPGVDVDTGEILDALPAADTDTDIDESTSIESEPEPEVQEAGDVDVDVKKSRLIDAILTQIGTIYSADDINSRAGQLRLLKTTFGHTQLAKIELLPLEKLETGLSILEAKAAVKEDSHQNE